LVDLAEEHCGDYDGWGCSVVGESDGEEGSG